MLKNSDLSCDDYQEILSILGITAGSYKQRSEIKVIVSCTDNPVLPAYLKSLSQTTSDNTGNGTIDFLNVAKIAQ